MSQLENVLLKNGERNKPKSPYIIVMVSFKQQDSRVRRLGQLPWSMSLPLSLSRVSVPARPFELLRASKICVFGAWAKEISFSHRKRPIERIEIFCHSFDKPTAIVFSKRHV